MISRIKFNTVNGAGEAIKDTDTGEWAINAPEGATRFYGTPQDVRRKIAAIKSEASNETVVEDARDILKEILAFWESGEPIHPRVAEEAQYTVERLERFIAEGQSLKEQLDHERREREAAQRTIARLGGVECLNIK